MLPNSANIPAADKGSETINSCNALCLLATQQVKQAELDLGEARRTNAALGTEKQRVDESIERLQLETDSTGRALKAAIADKEKQLVDHDVLKLQVGNVYRCK
jgi:hypothetical protein